MAWEKTDQTAGTTYIDSGVVPVSGTAARTVVFRFKTSDTYASDKYMGGWGNNSSGAAYRWRLDHSNSYRLRLEVGSGYITGDGSALNDGTWHCVAFSNAASSNITATTIYLDGSALGTAASSSRALSTSASNNFRLGEDSTLPSADGPEAAYAELAIYDRELAAAEMVMLTAGHITPASISEGRILYWPLIRDYVDLDGLSTPTLSGAAYQISAHPRVIYPSSQVLYFPPVATGGGGGPSVNWNGLTSYNWNGVTSFNWNGIA